MESHYDDFDHDDYDGMMVIIVMLYDVDEIDELMISLIRTMIMKLVVCGVINFIHPFGGRL